jgi:hypothetical protein
VRVENLSYSKAPFLPHFGDGIDKYDVIKFLYHKISRQANNNVRKMNKKNPSI